MQPPQSIEEIKAGLETTEKGGVRQSIRNCLTVFQRDPLLSGAIAYNILTDRKDIIKPIGFHRESTALNDTDMKYPPLMEKPMNQKPSLHQMEHYQKFYENGEYVRAVESTTEQNYNMIDGCANNLPKPRIINGRESVLDKLRIRQMAREKQKSSQEQSADMERNRK